MIIRLATPRLVVASCDPSDAPAIAEYHRRNAEHHAPWDPPRPAGFETDAWWADRLTSDADERREGRGCRLFLFLRPPADPADPAAAAAPDIPRGSRGVAVPVGGVNLSNVVRGAMQGCTLGYSLDRDYVGRGLMTEALRDAVLPFAFAPLDLPGGSGYGLHRIQAGHVPENRRSEAVLSRLGFRRIGVALRYLFIGGAWRDHVLNELVRQDAGGPGLRAAPRPPVRGPGG